MALNGVPNKTVQLFEVVCSILRDTIKLSSLGGSALVQAIRSPIATYFSVAWSVCLSSLTFARTA